MIEVELYGKEGVVVAVAEHPEYVDFAVRDSRATSRLASVSIADENFVAPEIAILDGRTAIETYSRMVADIAEIRAKHGGREDGTRILELLVGWGRRWPQARWHVVGAARASSLSGRFVTIATMPRYSATSLTADPLGRSVRFLGEAERMDEVDERAADLLPDFEGDVFGAALLQREIRIQPTGGGTRASVVKERVISQEENREKTRRRLQGDGFERSEKYFARVRPEVKTALMASGVGRELIELVGLALTRGKTVAEIRASLG